MKTPYTRQFTLRVPFRFPQPVGYRMYLGLFEAVGTVYPDARVEVLASPEPRFYTEFAGTFAPEDQDELVAMAEQLIHMDLDFLMNAPTEQVARLLTGPGPHMDMPPCMTVWEPVVTAPPPHNLYYSSFFIGGRALGIPDAELMDLWIEQDEDRAAEQAAERGPIDWTRCTCRDDRNTHCFPCPYCLDLTPETESPSPFRGDTDGDLFSV